jgi:4-amino-4-deoxy-L-arabinose transferase-like glycosyltransferase
LTYRWAGPDVRWIFAWQAMLGIASIFLVFVVSSRIFGHLAATIAALLGLLSGPLLFYEMVLLRTALITFTGLALVWLILWAERTSTWRRWLTTGIAFAAAVLVKTIFVIFFLGLLGLLAYRHRKRYASLPRPAAALVLGVALGLAPLVARNLAVGAPALALSSVNATAFAMSNGRHYEPRLNRIGLEEIARIMGETEGRFLPVVVETLRTHDTPFSYAGLVWRKFDALWHGFEMPNNASFYYYRLYSRTLRWLPVTFFVLSPLALVGLSLVGRRFESSLPLLLLVGSHVLVGVIALSKSRYRMPLEAALLPFAAWTIVWFFERLRVRNWLRAGTAAVLLLVLALWTSRPLPAEIKPIRDADCTALVRWHRGEHGNAAVREYLLTVLGVVPQSVGTLLSLGDLERHEGNRGKAAAYYERALQFDADNRYALSQLERLRTGRATRPDPL